jgi:FkbM family methyltransferase
MSRWDARSSAGRLLRMPLRILPPSAILPVLGGPLRGMRWVVGSAPHGAWLGILERDKLRHFVSRLQIGMTVWDIGANVGLYTLASARAVGPTGHVCAFEPMPRNLRCLRRHIALNWLDNVAICDAAVVDVTGMVRMAEGDSPSEFHAHAHGTCEVRAITLDDWTSNPGKRFPDVVKIDVEGSEDAVLRGGMQAFTASRPLIYLALHGERQRRTCYQLLTQWGYQLTSLEPSQALEISDEWLAEPGEMRR